MKLRTETDPVYPTDTYYDAGEELVEAQYIEMLEMMNDINGVLVSMHDLQRTARDVNSLKTTVDKYGLSQDIIHMTGEQELAQLLDKDSMPDLTEGNRQQLTGDVSTSLESLGRVIFQELMKVVDSIVEKIEQLVKKLMEFITNYRKQIRQERKRISGLEDVANKVFKKEVYIPNYMMINDKGRPEQIGTDQIEITKTIKNHLSNELPKLYKVIAKPEILIEEGREDMANLNITIQEGDKKALQVVGIDDTGKAKTLMNKTEEMFDEIKRLQSVPDDLQKFGKKLNRTLSTMEMTEEMGNQYQKLLNQLAKDAQKVVKVSVKLLKNNLEIARMIK